METTIEDLQRLQNVDVRTVDPNTLVQLESLKIDSDASHEEKVDSYVEHMKNPYCYLDKGHVTKISYSITTRTLEDIILHYLRGT